MLIIIFIFCGLFFLGARLVADYKARKELEAQKKREEKAKEIKELKIQEAIKSVRTTIECVSEFSPQIEKKYNVFREKMEVAFNCGEYYAFTNTRLSFDYAYYEDCIIPYKIVRLSADGVLWFFYPNAIIVRSRDKESVTIIPIDSINVSTTTQSVCKRTNSYPKDAKVISQYWEHSRLDGGPDLRYRSNAQITVLEYEVLNIDKHISLYFSKSGVTKPIMNALKNLIEAVGKEQKRIELDKERKKIEQDKQIDQQTEKFTSDSKKDSNQERNLLNHKNDKGTLEDAICSILSKNGYHIVGERRFIEELKTYNVFDTSSEYDSIINLMVEVGYLLQFEIKKNQTDFMMFTLANEFAVRNGINVHKCLELSMIVVKYFKE